MQKISVIRGIWRNCRLRDLDAFLAEGNAQGYRFLPLCEAIASDAGAAEKRIVMRHDVDHRTPATEMLADLERAHGVRGTYYFRWQTWDADLVRRLTDDGHECSLHYETLSDYYHARRLRPRRQQVNADILDTCVNTLRREIDEFEARLAACGVPRPIKTVAAHGDRINRVLGVPNNRVFEFAPERFPGIAEAYDRTYLSRLELYISDSPLRVCNGFAYGIDCQTALRRGPTLMQVLIHPNHWHLRLSDRIRESLRVLARGVITTPRQFQM